MTNESSEYVSFLADDDAAVHAMMSAGVNRSLASLTSDDPTAEDHDDSCGEFHWPVLFLFTVVIAAIGTITVRIRYNQ